MCIGSMIDNCVQNAHMKYNGGKLSLLKVGLSFEFLICLREFLFVVAFV